MGGLLSIPGFGEDKQEEAKKVIEDSVKTFTLHYVKSYGVELLNALKKEKEEEEWQLLTRPEDDGEPGDLMKGYLNKMTRGKKFVKRYFVVTSDYRWKYWETEESFKKGDKPKRVIVPAGFEAVENVLKRVTADAKRLGESLGLPIENVPVPSLPDKGMFGLYHDRRRSYILQAEEDEARKNWLKIAKLSAKECEGFEDTDEVHKKAYDTAIRKTRKVLKMDCDGWEYNGTEVQVFSEMLIDALDNTILSGVWSALREAGAPAAIRIKGREKVLGVADTSIAAAVNPAMAGMKTAISKLREKVEGTLKSKMDTINSVEAKVNEKIASLTQAIFSPIVDGKLKPHIARLLGYIQTPVTKAFAEVATIFDQRVAKFSAGAQGDATGKPVLPPAWLGELYQMHLSTQRPWELKSVYAELDSFSTGLKGVGEICEDVDPDEVHQLAKDSLVQILDKAYFTFGKTIEEEVKATSGSASKDAATVKATVAKVQGQVKQKMAADSKKATTILYQEVLTTIISGHFSKLVDPQCEPVLEPVEELIPEGLRDMFGVMSMYKRVKGSVVRGIVESVVPSQ